MFKFFKNKDGIVVINVIIAILAIALVASLTISLASIFGGSSDPVEDSGSVSENSSSEEDNSSEDENVANYLTFTGDEDFLTIALSNVEAVGVNMLISDDTETWQEWDGSDYKVKDSTVYVRGYNNVTFYLSDSYHCTFSGSYSEVNGCVTALLDYENYDSIGCIESCAFAYLFYQSEVTSSVNLYMPDSVLVIDGSAFEYCNSLTSIKLSDNLVMICCSAFYLCSSLLDISIGDKLLYVDEDVFVGCSISNVYFRGEPSQWAKINFSEESSNPLSNADNFYCNGVLTTDIIIEGISIIGFMAFYNCSMLKSVTIGSGVKFIKNYA
ncbi:MAG: leucine-rich repeat domain-containing protein, partial [Clostridia bacterium]|nr:leucine-rich repeat domain-containing protein [Clostridia bacterium]